MPIKMRSTANKSMTLRMIPSWQSRNFAWSGCMITIIGIGKSTGERFNRRRPLYVRAFFQIASCNSF